MLSNYGGPGNVQIFSRLCPTNVHSLPQWARNGRAMGCGPMVLLPLKFDGTKAGHKRDLCPIFVQACGRTFSLRTKIRQMSSLVLSNIGSTRLCPTIVYNLPHWARNGRAMGDGPMV